VGIAVTDLSFDRIGAAARLLARGFHADPISTFYLDDPVARRVAFPAFFRAVIYETFEAGNAYAALAGERLLGVAIWLPPSGATPSPAFRRRASRNHAVVRERFPRGADGLYAGFGALGSLPPEEPHWYLAFVGVDPAVQRSGVGSQLLSPVLAQADAASRLPLLPRDTVSRDPPVLPSPRLRTPKGGTAFTGCARPLDHAPQPGIGSLIHARGVLLSVRLRSP
jgi:GNAT superfamily N-acetyltransferase